LGTYIARRLLQSVVILFGLAVIFFFILHLTPGGPCAAEEGTGLRGKLQQRSCAHRLGLNQPLYVQFIKQMGPYLEGNLGTSNSGEPVAQEFTDALPATVVLIGVSYALQLLLAIPLGIFAALYRYSFFDQVFTFFSYVGFSMPSFWLGLILIFIVAVHFHALPAGNIVSTNIPIFWTSGWFHLLEHDPALVLGDLARHLVLPVITLLIVGVAGDSRYMRASLLDVLHQDYIRTAKAKGLKHRIVVFKHALRNAILPIVTNIALDLPSLVGGAVITETIFSWSGLGFLYIQELNVSDYPTIEALLMISAVAVLLSNLLADVVYAWVDPRIRYD